MLGADAVWCGVEAGLPGSGCVTGLVRGGEGAGSLTGVDRG